MQALDVPLQMLAVPQQVPVGVARVVDELPMFGLEYCLFPQQGLPFGEKFVPSHRLHIGRGASTGPALHSSGPRRAE